MTKEFQKERSFIAKQRGFGLWMKGRYCPYLYTKEANEKRSLALKGRKQSEEHRLKNKLGHLGIKVNMTEEQRKARGQKTLTTRRKNGKPWFPEGTSEKIRRTVKNLYDINPEYRKLVSQRTKEKMWEPETRVKYLATLSQRSEKISKALTGRKLSEEQKRKIKEYKNRPEIKEFYRQQMLGKHLSEKTKEKLRQARLKQKPIFKDTSIEQKIEKLLIREGIEYRKQVPLLHKFIVDFLIPNKNLVIECDGDYWHNRLGVQEKDKIRDNTLTQNGYTVIRLWEHEINKELPKCFERIKYAIQ